MTSERNYPSSKIYDKSATIASGQTLSEAIDTQGTQLTGLFIPSTFDGTTLYIQAATDIDGTYGRIQVSGSDFALTVSAGKPVAIENLAVTAGFQFIKLEAATAQTTTDTVITLALRPV